MKRLCLSSLLCLSVMATLAQTQLSLPNILPASPEPASMAKAGNMDVSLSSGMANASIPLYEMKVGKHSLPVSLNYSSNGYRVDEISSRVGTGWTLSATGVITRTVRGRPDDKSTRVSHPAGNVTLQQLVDYYDRLTMPQYEWDNEPDEYSISAPGLSGKFILDNNGQAVKIPYNNNRIEVVQNANEIKVTVTTTTGAKYYFGFNNMVEKTQSHNMQGKLIGFQQTITALFLTRIEYPDGNFVNYHYNPISYSVQSGLSQSLTTGLLTNMTDPKALCKCSGTLGDMQGSQVGPGPLQTHLSTVVYNSYYLNYISTSDYQTISFFYSQRPDGMGDLRVRAINFSGGHFSKTYRLLYEDPPQVADAYTHQGSSLHKNFFLKEVNWDVPVQEDQFETLRYKMSYHKLANLPSRLNYGQDHMGFYNGKPNHTLLPATPNTAEVNWGSQYAVADRNPDYQYAMIGMLQRITHPTGGYEEFEYEANQYAVQEQVNTTTVAKVTGAGNSLNGSYQSMTYYSSSFSILMNQNANLSFWAGANPGCASCSPPAPNTTNIAYLYVQDINSNSDVWSGILRDYSTITLNVPLAAGRTYRLKLVVRGQPNYAHAEIRYDYSDGPVYAYVNHEAPGLRIKSIKSLDPVSANEIRRHFFYSNQIGSNISSAIYLFEPDYITDSYSITLCQSDLPPNDLAACRSQNGVTAYQLARARRKTMSSNTAYTAYGFDGSQILYKNVFESNDPDLKNGYTEHKYEGYPVINSTLVHGSMLKHIPTNTITTINHHEKETNYYDKNKKLVRKVLNYYSCTGTDYLHQVSAIAANKRQSHVYSDWNSTEIMVEPYDIVQYDYQSLWVQLDSTITIDYDGTNSIRNRMSYHYGAAVNMQPVKTETVNSTGDVLSSEMKYPTDFPGSPVYQSMISRNLITPVVESRQKKNNVELAMIRTNYFQWHQSPGAVIIEPQTVVAKRGNFPEETRIRYHAFDQAGNPLEVSKENGKRISYLWDYNRKYPVAEVQNAEQADIAYTSFEAEGSGNWNFDANGIVNIGITGYRCYSGGIYKSVNPAKAYMVTLWCGPGGQATVNDMAGKLLLTKRGWRLFQWEVTNVAVVSVKGQFIDELRLFPKGAQMVTRTYFPLIGTREEVDQNSRFVQYQYDGAARLLRIRDMDSNIVKQFEYQYLEQINPCASTAAAWQSTGQVRCEQAGPNNNFTGYRQREEIDLNNCSPTYLEKRWVNFATHPGCAPVPNCTGPDKRVVNGVCETGSKILVSSVQTGASQWQCTYRYVWSDGFASPNFVENSSTNCSVASAAVE